MEKKLTYVAVPYSHKDPAVSQERFDLVTRFAGKLTEKGDIVFSPVTHSHPIVQEVKLPNTWDFWERHDRAFLEMSKELVVLMLEGWTKSQGVTAEIEIAKELDIPIFFYEVHEKRFIQTMKFENSDDPKF